MGVAHYLTNWKDDIIYKKQPSNNVDISTEPKESINKPFMNWNRSKQNLFGQLVSMKNFFWKICLIKLNEKGER